MTIEFTEEQRRQIVGIPATHINNMQTAFIAAYRGDQKRAKFDETQLRVTELLVPFFVLPETPEDQEDQDDLDESDVDQTKTNERVIRQMRHC
ncbi:hypothetical protein [Granulicella sp. L60]|uniref:hypothetical protein n=1 Tax=Granulicella sp. L60 TaxID=1641866 RepID=UPI00131A7156|nr:hypothetical protein [Granulicella sp. L60]